MMKALLTAALSVCAAITPAIAQPAPKADEFRVNRHVGGGQFTPAVAVSSGGGFVIAWVGEDDITASLEIRARLYDRKGWPITDEFRVNSTTPGDQLGPIAGMDDSGGFVILWRTFDEASGKPGLLGQRFDADGEPIGGEFPLTSWTTLAPGSAKMVMHPAGSFVVVWSGTVPYSPDPLLVGRRFDGEGAPLGPEFVVASGIFPPSGPAPDVATNDSGALVVVWQEANLAAPAWPIRAQRFDADGAPIGGAILVNSITWTSESEPSVGLDEAGNFVVAWRTSVWPSEGLFVRRFDSTGIALGTETRVNAHPYSPYGGPASVVMSPAGTFLIVYTGQTSDDYEELHDVYGRLFDAGGRAVGSEFRVNGPMRGPQLSSQVRLDGAGGFVAAWESNFGDPTGSNIQARMFCVGDIDGDFVCDAEDVIVTSPRNGDRVGCDDPRASRPTIAWSPGRFDRFKVLVSWDSDLWARKRVSSGDRYLKTTSYTVPTKKWRTVCSEARAAQPWNPQIYIRVLGVDSSLPKKDPEATTGSQIVDVGAVP